jgi:hypothetical protein
MGSQLALGAALAVMVAWYLYNQRKKESLCPCR